MLSEYDHHSKKITHKSVNACLMPLCYVDHKAITTLEGLGSVVRVCERVCVNIAYVVGWKGSVLSVLHRRVSRIALYIRLISINMIHSIGAVEGYIPYKKGSLLLTVRCVLKRTGERGRGMRD